MTDLRLVSGGKDVSPVRSPLADALAPLQREYLRRLTEMAGRVKPESLLREATTRDQGGVLINGPDGFPMRFDVADSETGSTFEVRSARYDDPASTFVRVGALEVELKAGCWEALNVDCRFDGQPVGEDAVALCGLLRAFAELGQFGAFSPRGAAEPWSGRVHSFSVQVSGNSVAALYDMGSAPPEALDTLFQALDGFGRDRAPLAKVILGGPPPDPARAL